MHFSWQTIADLAWLLTLAGAAIFLIYTRRRLQTIAKTWQVAIGRITAFEWTHPHHLPWPKIEYSYRVDEQEYLGHQLLLKQAKHDLNAKRSRLIAYKVAVAYEKDDTIEVYYNPNNPQEAVLDVSSPKNLDWLIGLLVALLILHLIIILSRSI